MDRSHRDTSRDRTAPRRRVLVPDPGAFPAVDGVHLRPRWYIRIRGLLSMGLLVCVMGVLVAIAIASVLVLAIVAAVSSLD